MKPTIVTAFASIILATMISLINGCSRITMDPAEYGFLTGESLENNTLATGLQISKNQFAFSAVPNMKSTREKIDPTAYRVVPTPEIFESFGKHSKTVHNEYNRVFEDCRQQKKGNFFISMILYQNEVHLIADKPFAGHPAGEDLAPYCTLNNGYFYTENKFQFAENESLQHYYMIPYTVFSPMLTFPVEDHTLVDENVTFTLTIPVKAGMYLTWLRDRIDAPNTPMYFQDLVLEGTIHSKKGLH